MCDFNIWKLLGNISDWIAVDDDDDDDNQPSDKDNVTQKEEPHILSKNQLLHSQTQ